MTWRQDAACIGMTAEFFPKSDDRPALHAAIAICETCPVKAECLATSLANGEGYGVWGGESVSSRRRRRKARLLAGCGTRASYVRGCRCAECYAAHLQYHQINRELKR